MTRTRLQSALSREQAITSVSSHPALRHTDIPFLVLEDMVSEGSTSESVQGVQLPPTSSDPSAALHLSPEILADPLCRDQYIP